MPFILDIHSNNKKILGVLISTFRNNWCGFVILCFLIYLIVIVFCNDIFFPWLLSASSHSGCTILLNIYWYCYSGQCGQWLFEGLNWSIENFQLWGLLGFLVVSFSDTYEICSFFKLASRRNEAAGWLRKMIGVVAAKDLPAEPSEEEFRLGLRSGIILCNVLNKVQPGAVPKVSQIHIWVSCFLGTNCFKILFLFLYQKQLLGSWEPLRFCPHPWWSCTLSISIFWEREEFSCSYTRDGSSYLWGIWSRASMSEETEKKKEKKDDD